MAGSSSRSHIRAERIEFSCEAGAPRAMRLRNRQTRASVCSRGELSAIVRFPHAVSDPVFLTEVRSFVVSDSACTYTLSDSGGSVRGEVRISACAEGLRFDAVIEADSPVWIAEWKLSGLDLDSVLIPALGGQSLSPSMPQGTTLSYKYPFWWNAQFLVGTTAGGGIWFRTMETDPHFRLVRVRRGDEGFDLTYGFEADAPLTACRIASTWYLDCYRGSWKVPVEIHRSWMESAFALTKLGSHPHLPAWARETDIVLELWGIGKESPEPLHTFRQMERRLSAWAKLYEPARTLVYLPGYAEHGIDSRAPAYDPSPELGGPDAFRSLVNVAHRMGYRVMLHTNVLGMTFDHPEFAAFRQHQVVDAFGQPQGWGLDIDGDWLAEPFFAYINPGVQAWGDLMERVIRDLVTRFSVDGVFLDQTLLAFNVSHGPNFIAGMASHIRRLQHAFPQTLFAGEGLHEHVVGCLPMAQIHGIDSIAEVHGVDGRVRWRRAHPISTHLFGKYTRFTGHLLTRHPSHPMFALQEEAYGRLGVLPVLALYNNGQELNLPAVRAMIRRAKHFRRQDHEDH
jgi:hypothetical protein